LLKGKKKFLQEDFRFRKSGGNSAREKEGVEKTPVFEKGTVKRGGGSFSKNILPTPFCWKEKEKRKNATEGGKKRETASSRLPGEKGECGWKRGLKKKKGHPAQKHCGNDEPAKKGPEMPVQGLTGGRGKGGGERTGSRRSLQKGRRGKRRKTPFPGRTSREKGRGLTRKVESPREREGGC